jgi:hypothetical protein
MLAMRKLSLLFRLPEIMEKSLELDMLMRKDTPYIYCIHLQHTNEILADSKWFSNGVLHSRLFNSRTSCIV